MKTLNIIALTLVIIGAINWGLLGFFDFDLVSTLFGNMSMITHIIFGAVGIAGLYSLTLLSKISTID